jgi:hypothetical protein
MREWADVTRRDLLQGTAAGSIALATSAMARPDSAAAQTGGTVTTKPNILFILADDLGYADVSCYGRRDFSTPSIDRIAAEGMRFTRLTRIPRFAPPPAWR